MTGIFLHNWNSKEEMIASFESAYSIDNPTQEQRDKYAHVDVLLASYGTDNYIGNAFVLFRNNKDGQLYENHGSHCSCYGLENQWREELTTIESLRKRVNEGSLGSDDYSDNVFKDDLIKVLDELEGTEGQDRDSYADDQDRDSYTADPEPEQVEDKPFGIKPMVRWVKIPTGGKIRGQGTWRKFNDVWPNGTHWDNLVETKFLPTKELPEGETPSG